MTDQTRFWDRLGDPTSPVAVDFTPESSSLLIAFGGIAGGLDMPPFEFFNLTSCIDTKKIFVRDLEQVWYHHGLSGIATNIDGVATWLGRTIREQSPGRVVVCGNSMGGYAALLFGALLDVDEVMAFAPQTFVSTSQRIAHLDPRWRGQMRKLHRSITAQREYFDLKQSLARIDARRTKLHIHFCAGNRLDRLHAKRLDHDSRVELHAYPSDHHAVVKHLRASGELADMLEKALH